MPKSDVVKAILAERRGLAKKIKANDRMLKAAGYTPAKRRAGAKRKSKKKDAAPARRAPAEDKGGDALTAKEKKEKAAKLKEIRARREKAGSGEGE